LQIKPFESKIQTFSGRKDSDFWRDGLNRQRQASSRIEILPKRRADLQTVCYWIDRRIARHGKPEVLQLIMNKCYFVVRSDRPRLPPLRDSGYKGANNLMRIPAGSVLYKRYVRLGRGSYLRKFLDDPVKVKELGIFFKGGSPWVPIYEVIDGLAFTQRKSDHILAAYESVIASLRKIVSEGRATLADTAFRSASSVEKRQVLLAVAHAEKRIEDIQAIVSEHVTRQIALKFTFDAAISRLEEMGVILERIAFHIRTRNVRIGAIQRVTNQVLEQMPFFNSKEIRDKLRSVSIALKALSAREDKNAFATYLLSERLRQVAQLLFEAAEILQAEALKVDEKERKAASKLIQFR
jgi:hypothetical protein